jgi:hypothetical protein
MDERIRCPLCQHDNISENRFCGHCGASLTGRGQLTRRQEASPAPTARSLLLTKIGPAGKALTLGLAVLATEAGLAWMRRRAEHDNRLSTLARSTKSADSERVIGQSIEEVFVWLQEEGNFQGRGLARRVLWASGTARPRHRRL